MTRPASPFAPPPPRKVKVRTHKDPVTAELRAYVLRRDGGCVGLKILEWKAGEGRTAITFHQSPCDGPVEIDHVRASGGLGLRSPSEKLNLVALCRWHHRAKTEFGRIWRPLLLAYLERVEPVGER